MNHDFHSQAREKARPSAGRWALIGFVLIAAFFLLTEHRAHFLGGLPWLFPLACPFLHYFMHGAHGGHGRPHAGHGTGIPTDTGGNER